MKLSIINGSPRGTSSNTEKLLEHFIKGFIETEGNIAEKYYVFKERPSFENLKKVFLDAEVLMIAFPLYVDAMPGSVKEFIESLEGLKGKRPDLKIMFMIQNGFPETHHNRFVERYCAKLAGRLGCIYLGSICKGGCEGLTIQPPVLVEKVFSGFYKAGRSFGETGKLDPEVLTKLARPEHLTPENLLQVIPMVNNFLWDGMLTKNNAMDKKFDKPFE
ncbi:MAG TPA: NAD(P)H-dependent oxidoreductase [Spirochaetota bacterium]|nr:NAD(P)H-dependent oxidoreductase [Spirochaetota bacterium]